MKVEIRKTAQGTEYWDTEEKKTLFMPAGQEPNFDVTVNPDSMVQGVDMDKGKEKEGKPYGVNDGEQDYQLDEMTIKELKALAAKSNIEVPKDVTKRDDIAQYIFDTWLTDGK
ncbi:hypothetical protein LIS77_06595 [Cytobacillus firmus]|nr:hypothetical protein [Cytobacillus firmus]USK41364.1 hypothetical protein LIS77_06595 [Cytobacillus firmus]